ncbi:hypothetical protein IT087_02360 [Candidatus Uhrbacteria bacterium]|nr:hypothetical protein [Candidatus Uhrbacteria bacterium]
MERPKNVLIVPVIILVGLAGYGLYAQTTQLTTDKTGPTSEAPVTISTPTSTPVELVPEPPKPIRVELPEEVRGLYWTADSSLGPRGNELLEYMLRTKLNTAVIDIKLDNGALAFPATSTLERLGQKGIYRIARIAVMRDSTYAKAHPESAVKSSAGGLWRDKTGAIWLDPGAPDVADFAIEVGRKAISMGFDELQYDYVRFPSDGVLGTIRYPISGDKDKAVVMREFFDKIGTLREEGITISIDVFGMTYWSSSHFGIGQRLEDVYPNADFISPMVYPSHYPTNFRGFGNPALYPYEIVKQTLDKGAEMLEVDHFVSSTISRPKSRPWLQDFDIGAEYTAARIEAQIKAARDAGASGWMLWNARNVYEPAKYVE